MDLKIGQVCTKTAGRETGQRCLVIDTVDDNFVMISGPRVKRRRCNVKHLDAMSHVLSIKKGATDEEVINILTKAGLMEGITVKKPKPKKEVKPQVPKPEEEKPKKKLLALRKPKVEKKEEKSKKPEPKKEKKKIKAENVTEEILAEVKEELRKEKKK